MIAIFIHIAITVIVKDTFQPDIVSWIDIFCWKSYFTNKLVSHEPYDFGICTLLKCDMLKWQSTKKQKKSNQMKR